MPPKVKQHIPAKTNLAKIEKEDLRELTYVFNGTEYEWFAKFQVVDVNGDDAGLPPLVARGKVGNLPLPGGLLAEVNGKTGFVDGDPV